MKLTTLGVILILYLSHTNSVVAEVIIFVEKERYAYALPPQLSEIIAPIQTNKNWYWPTTALYQINDTYLEQTRRSLIENIERLAQGYISRDPKTAKSLKNLGSSISSWRLARRVSIKIDFDMARIETKANPRIPEGEYILDGKQRSNSVTLFGAILNTKNLIHKGYSDVSEYIDRQDLIKLANQDYVILIQADGRKIHTPVAYWNKGHQEAMPGSQIFIPFRLPLFHSEFALINEQITLLALNRVQ